MCVVLRTSLLCAFESFSRSKMCDQSQKEACFRSVKVQAVCHLSFIPSNKACSAEPNIFWALTKQKKEPLYFLFSATNLQQITKMSSASVQRFPLQVSASHTLSLVLIATWLGHTLSYSVRLAPFQLISVTLNRIGHTPQKAELKFELKRQEEDLQFWVRVSNASLQNKSTNLLDKTIVLTPNN